MSSEQQTQRTPRRRHSPLAAASVAAAVLLVGGGGAYWAASAGGDGAAAGPGAVGGTPPVLTLGGATDGGSGGTDLGGAAPAPTGSGPAGIAPGEPDPHGGGPWGPVVYRASGDLPKGPGSAPVYRAQGSVGADEVSRLARALGVEGTPKREGGSWLVGALADGSGAQLRVAERAPGTWTFSRAPGPRGSVDCLRGKPCTTGEPVGEEAARKAAAPVLEALGLRDARLDTSQVLGGARVVNADPVVGGLPTYGWTTGLPVGPDGRVVGGSGQLKGLTKGADYPVVDAARALDLLNGAGRKPRLPDVGGCATPVPAKEQKQGTSVDGTEPAPPLGRIAPCEPRQVPPRTVTVGSAVLGLATTYADGQQMLVPSWLFGVRPTGDEKPYTVTYPAVDPKFLAAPKPPVSAPPQDPATTPDRHVDSYRTDGRKLTVTFWGGVCSEYALKAAEKGGTVTVRVVESNPDPKRVCIALAKKLTASVTLDRPLDGRQVLDESGRAVPRG
ncbi:hypothetical protein ACFYVL_23280 [Streptomyces sp. NPDC004111]|uniref:hypothetical protein n=1 Tax=Streptomyces sp. NPDC004111 TaxID=3364690 RepID=UPI0036869B4A